MNQIIIICITLIITLYLFELDSFCVIGNNQMTRFVAQSQRIIQTFYKKDYKTFIV